MFNIKVKRLTETAIEPKYAIDGDSGMDLFSDEDVVISTAETKLVNTNIKIELPNATEAQIRPRSGLALKHNITVLNTPGTIDQGYRGVIGVILINHGKEDFHIEKGDRIAQMVIKPVYHCKIEMVDEENDLSLTKRGEKGYGSTGRD